MHQSSLLLHFILQCTVPLGDMCSAKPSCDLFEAISGCVVVLTACHKLGCCLFLLSETNKLLSLTRYAAKQQPPLLHTVGKNFIHQQYKVCSSTTVLNTSYFEHMNTQSLFTLRKCVEDRRRSAERPCQHWRSTALKYTKKEVCSVGQSSIVGSSGYRAPSSSGGEAEAWLPCTFSTLFRLQQGPSFHKPQKD